MMALDTTFIITCSSRFRSPMIMGKVSPYSRSRVWPRRWASSSTARHTDSMASKREKRVILISALPESRRLRVSRS